jgi:DNA-binding IclR family transcriptional regulator
MTKISEEAARKYRIPVIERMAEVFALLERSPKGVTIGEVVDHVGLSRTTAYRMLNTLGAYDFVTRSAEGAYTLGQRLVTLAARVAPRTAGYDLLVVAQPHLERLSEATRQGSKVSVLAGDEVLVVAAAQGNGQYALTTSPGQRLPVHAGAAGKLLLAHLPRADIEVRLAGKLAVLTAKTIAEPKRLLAELARIRQRGWSFDQGEQMSGVHAIAAPIRDGSNDVVAALSVPFVAGVGQVEVDEIRRLAIAAAEAISAETARLESAAKAGSANAPVAGRKGRDREATSGGHRPLPNARVERTIG